MWARLVALGVIVLMAIPLLGLLLVIGLILVGAIVLRLVVDQLFRRFRARWLGQSQRSDGRENVRVIVHSE